jgi:hypothetical protein
MRPRGSVLVGIGIGIVTALAGCTGHSGPVQSTDATNSVARSVMHVRALLQSTHLDANGHWRRVSAPMSGYFVLAADESGRLERARVNARGDATMRLDPGKYVLTLSLRNACYPLKATVRAATERTVTLPCVAP